MKRFDQPQPPLFKGEPDSPRRLLAEMRAEDMLLDAMEKADLDQIIEAVELGSGRGARAETALGEVETDLDAVDAAADKEDTLEGAKGKR